MGFCEGEVMWHWQGLEMARLKEQRKKRLALGDKAPSGESFFCRVCPLSYFSPSCSGFLFSSLLSLSLCLSLVLVVFVL